MVFTFLAVAARLLTSSGSAATTVNPTTEPNQHVQQVVTSVSTVAPRHLPRLFHEEPASLPEQNLEQKVKTSRPKTTKYSK